jgi:DNA-binding response OmpR family regulator
MQKKEKILLVEDDPNLGFVTKDNLQDEGYDVVLCKDGQSAFTEFFKKTFDLCILDVMLPKKDGFALAEDIRKINTQVPILFLSARSKNEDKIKGFQSGADDYLTKPFSMDELYLRIKAILKRSKKSEQNTTTPIYKDRFELGNVLFDYKNVELNVLENKYVLTRKEAELLRLLFIHENQVLSREMALELIWGEDDYFLGRSMDVFISKLRKYLKDEPRVQILNVHGVGFKFTFDYNA